MARSSPSGAHPQRDVEREKRLAFRGRVRGEDRAVHVGLQAGGALEGGGALTATTVPASMSTMG